MMVIKHNNDCKSLLRRNNNYYHKWYYHCVWSNNKVLNLLFIFVIILFIVLFYFNYVLYFIFYMFVPLNKLSTISNKWSLLEVSAVANISKCHSFPSSCSFINLWFMDSWGSLFNILYSSSSCSIVWKEWKWQTKDM